MSAKETWTRALKAKGPQVVAGYLQQAIQTEVLLMAAAKISGIDWCIDTLERAKENPEFSFLGTVLDPKARTESPKVSRA